MHLAQIALGINRLAGGELDFKDFLFIQRDEDEQLKEYFDFKPRGK